MQTGRSSGTLVRAQAGLGMESPYRPFSIVERRCPALLAAVHRDASTVGMQWPRCLVRAGDAPVELVLEHMCWFGWPMTVTGPRFAYQPEALGGSKNWNPPILDSTAPMV